MTTITGLRGLTLDPGGNTIFEKSADTLQAPASMTKVVTAYVARQWLPLSHSLTVASGDLVGGSTANLLSGDVLTFEQALYGMMLPSGNDAATCVGRVVGDTIRAARGGTTGGLARFLPEMVAATTAAFGWAGQYWADVSGLSSSNRATMRQVCEILRHIGTTDPTLRGIMGTLAKAITIGGPNARTINLAHTVDPNGAVPLPEFLAGKTGATTAAGACVVAMWEHQGGRYVSGIMNSTSTDRFIDLRAVMNAGIAATTRRATALRSGAALVAAVALDNSRGLVAPAWGST